VLNVSFLAAENEAYEISITGLVSCHALLKVDGLSAKGENMVTLDLSGFPNGIYVLELKSRSVLLKQRIEVIK
jgi:hypothetical protein